MSVTVVVPTLARRADHLERCLASVAGQDVLLVVDLEEGSVPTPAGPVVLWTGGGGGFAGAAQKGIDATRGDFVLLLNDDAWLEPGALEVMTQVLSSDPGAAGVAPKIMFETWPEIINSVGTVLLPDGWADSRGIGQPDVGQYDHGGRVFGLHLAAALVRRSLFAADEVGPLDGDYGMYYEDIDWCLRANLRGYEFVAAPQARAVHSHSSSAAAEPYSFRFKHQERNRMLTAGKSFQAPRAARVVARRSAVMAWTAVRRPSQACDAIAVVGGVARGMPGVFRKRRAVQRSRVMRDRDVFELSAGERPWFDQATGPVLSVDCLVDGLRRSPDTVSVAHELSAAIASDDAPRVAAALATAPAAATTYLRRLKAVSPS